MNSVGPNKGPENPKIDNFFGRTTYGPQIGFKDLYCRRIHGIKNKNRSPSAVLYKLFKNMFYFPFKIRNFRQDRMLSTAFDTRMLLHIF